MLIYLLFYRCAVPGSVPRATEVKKINIKSLPFHVSHHFCVWTGLVIDKVAKIGEDCPIWLSFLFWSFYYYTLHFLMNLSWLCLLTHSPFTSSGVPYSLSQILSPPTQHAGVPWDSVLNLLLPHYTFNIPEDISHTCSFRYHLCIDTTQIWYSWVLQTSLTLAIFALL